MDKQSVIRKRDQRHLREIAAKKDRMISDYIRYKYPNIYAEAEQYYNEMNDKYPIKKDLLKTVEHIAWRKKVQEERSKANKLMELKIELLKQPKKKSTRETCSTETTTNTETAAESPTETAAESPTSAVIDSPVILETGPNNVVSSCFLVEHGTVVK